MTSRIIGLNVENSGVDVNGTGIIEFRAHEVELLLGDAINQFSLLTKPEFLKRLPIQLCQSFRLILQ